MRRIRAKHPGQKREKKIVRTFTATQQELGMLELLARYHGFSKSATITSLLKKEFWRVFPGGTGDVRPDPGARIAGGGSA
jgi:hypothetical protein